MSDLLSLEESVDLVASMLGGALRAEMFLLHGHSGEPHIEARLTVDPDIALAALKKAGLPR